MAWMLEIEYSVRLPNFSNTRAVNSTLTERQAVRLDVGELTLDAKSEGMARSSSFCKGLLL